MPAQNVRMQMIHLLPTDTAGVDDGAKPVIGPLSNRKPSGQGQNSAQNIPVRIVAFQERGHVVFRND